jgi:hypothetical protein
MQIGLGSDAWSVAQLYLSGAFAAGKPAWGRDQGNGFLDGLTGDGTSA